MKRIKYVKPPFEYIQHVVTAYKKDSKGKLRPAETSLHSDVSLLQRLDKLNMTSDQLLTIKEQLQPLVNKDIVSDFVSQYGSISDDDLIQSCPSRYIQTASEQMDAAKYLAQRQKEIESKISEQKEKETERQSIIDRENELQTKLNELWSSNFKS